MRKQPLLPYIFLRALQACVVLLFCACLAACGSDTPQGASGESKLRVKVVNVRGTKVRLPIPDGYEEMQREDDPKEYDWMVSVTSDEGTAPLMYLINSEGKAHLKNNQHADLRHGFALSEDSFWDAVIHDDTMKTIKIHFYKYIKDVNEGANRRAKKKGRILSDYDYIHDGKKSISCIRIPQKSKSGKEYVTARTISYVVVDKKVVSFDLYMRIYNANDILSLKNMTVSFLKKIDQELF